MTDLDEDAKQRIKLARDFAKELSAPERVKGLLAVADNSSESLRPSNQSLDSGKDGTVVASVITNGIELQMQRALAFMGRIYVGSIPFDLGEDDVRQTFSICGPVKAVSMSVDSLTQKHKGFCFVEYEVPESAILALSQMDGMPMGQRTLRVGRPNNAPALAGAVEQISKEGKAHPRLFVSGIHRSSL